MKDTRRRAISVWFAALLLGGAIALPGAPADAEEAAGADAGGQAAGSLTDTMKEAGAHGVATAADEAANGADMKSAASKGTSAAVNKALGTTAPAIPTAPPAAAE